MTALGVRVSVGMAAMFCSGCGGGRATLTSLTSVIRESSGSHKVVLLNKGEGGSGHPDPGDNRL